MTYAWIAILFDLCSFVHLIHSFSATLFLPSYVFSVPSPPSVCIWVTLNSSLLLVVGQSPVSWYYQVNKLSSVKPWIRSRISKSSKDATPNAKADPSVCVFKNCPMQIVRIDDVLKRFWSGGQLCHWTWTKLPEGGWGEQSWHTAYYAVLIWVRWQKTRF